MMNVANNPFMQSIIMLSFMMLSGIMLNVIILNVEGPPTDGTACGMSLYLCFVEHI
jgi:hypothetical protein